MKITTVTGLPRAEAIPAEIVERKGIGHPDTLADGVAEAVSREYSRYCLEQFGAVLHHNTDKTALLGGSAEVGFGHGRLTSPIVAMVNGRLTPRLGDHEIPVSEIIDRSVRTFFHGALPLLDVATGLRIRTRVSQASSPGAVAGKNSGQRAGRRYWFAPRTLDDLAERHRMFANDTSAGVGYAPLSHAERLATGIEAHLTSEPFLTAHPYFGTDIKVMVVRTGTDTHITACVPQIASRTANLEQYVWQRAKTHEVISETAAAIAPQDRITVAVNTRDDDTRQELYLTATGTSLESGDEGVVGRGNRVNGLISLMRPMSMEGASGKNPVYHVGKLYNLAAQRAAERLHENTGRTCVVALVSQSGRDLDDPWQAIVQTSGPDALDQSLVRRTITAVMEELDDIRGALLAGKLLTA